MVNKLIKLHDYENRIAEKIEKAILRVLEEYGPTPAEGVEEIMNATWCILSATGTALGEDGYKFAKDIFTNTLKQL